MVAKLPYNQRFHRRLSLFDNSSLCRLRHHFLLPRSKLRIGKRAHKRYLLQHFSAKKLKRANADQKDVSKVEEKLDISKVEEKRDIRKVEEENKQEISTTVDETKIEDVFHELCGIPMVPSNQSKRKPPGVIFVFEKASLVPAFVGKKYQILNPNDHGDYLRRKKLDPYSYRPDIIFQAFREVTDSKLYKVGRIQAVYVKTDQGVLIKIEPHTHIPRTSKSFCAMMLELLQKLSIKAKGKGEKLLRLVKNPVTQHLPVNSFKIGLSFSSQKVVRLKDYVGAISNDVTPVFIVGAMAHGQIDCDYADDLISVSEFPLSAACCIRRISCALAEKWKIV